MSSLSKSTLYLLTLLVFFSCSKGAQQRQHLVPVQGSDNLISSSEFASFAKVVSQTQTKAVTDFPNNNSQFNRIVHYKEARANQFDIKLKGQKYTCHYSYDQATEETSFTKETVTTDQGKDLIEYKYQTTTIPINATYTTIPNISEVKVACDDQISLLNLIGKKTTIDFSASWKSFQTLMNQQLVELLAACSRSARVDGHRCVGAHFSRSQKSEANPVDTYAFTIDFTWQEVNGEQSQSTIEIEVAPSLYYLETYGILNLPKGLPLSDSGIDLPSTQIQTLKLSGL